MRHRLTRCKTQPQDQGMTLLELAVAILVLSLGSLAALSAVDQTRVTLGGAAPRLLAQIVAQNRAEELQLLGAYTALPKQVQMGGQLFDIQQTQQTTAGGFIQATITVRSQAGPGAVLQTWVPLNREP